MNKQYPIRRWRSCARWPHALRLQDDLSTDEHDTREQAEAVCVGLRREGLGGERCHFPLECWVEPFVAPVCPEVVKTAPPVPELQITRDERNGYFVSGWSELCEWGMKNDPTWKRLYMRLEGMGLQGTDVVRCIVAVLLHEKYGQSSPFKKEEHKMTAPGNTPAVDGSPGVKH